MTTNPDKKLMNLLDNHVPETVLLASWLEKSGVSRDLQKYYLRSGWLEHYGSGAFKRPNENVQWVGAMYSLQRQTDLQVHVGGLTSLSLQGLAHYARLGKEILYMFSTQYAKLPKWFLDQEWGTQVKYVKTKILPLDLGLFEYKVGTINLRISSPERAILECLHLSPSHFDLVECYQVFEGLSNLRPKLLQELLEKCASIKVKRLFLYMAVKAKHQWLPFVDQTNIELGKGDRILVKGGVYISQHRISIPKELATL